MKNSEQAIKRGKELLKRRKSNGFSRKKMSKILGISDTAIANFENGITENISIDLGKKFAEALGVSFNELFEIETPDSNKVEELEKELIRIKDKVELFEIYRRAFVQEKTISERMVFATVLIIFEKLKEKGTEISMPGLTSYEVRKRAIKDYFKEFPEIELDELFLLTKERDLNRDDNIR